MLAWLGVSARCGTADSFWTAPNLLASTFYGEFALRNRFTVHTLSGLALFLLIYGSLGIFFGLAMQHRRGGLLLACRSAGWSRFLLPGIRLDTETLESALALYSHDRPMLAGHVLYGAMLGYYAKNLQRLVGQAVLPAPTQS